MSKEAAKKERRRRRMAERLRQSSKNVSLYPILCEVEPSKP